MKRAIIASFYTLLAGAFSLLLLASIVFSCRGGGDPHHTTSLDTTSGPMVQEDVVQGDQTPSAQRLKRLPTVEQKL